MRDSLAHTSPNFPYQWVGFLLAITLSLLLWFIWVIYDGFLYAKTAEMRLTELERLRGDIIYLDEVLTLSATMALSSKDTLWVARYKDHKPKLDVALDNAISIAEHLGLNQGANETLIANTRLVSLEYQVFDLIEAGNTDKGNEIIQGGYYQQQKELYYQGMMSILQDLKFARDINLSLQKQRLAVSVISGLLLILANLLVWYFVFQRIKKWKNDLVETTYLKRTNQLLNKELVQHIEEEEQMKILAYYDELTKLPNRTLFMDRLTKALELAQRKKYLCAILFIDLDKFKAVNDVGGHDIGDQILQMVSKRISSCLRKSDTVARFGGDEFLCVVNDAKCRDSISKLSLKLVNYLNAPYFIDDRKYVIGSSIGISLYPDHATEGEALIARADEAMYNVKNAGKNNFFFWQAPKKPPSLAMMEKH